MYLKLLWSCNKFRLFVCLFVSRVRMMVCLWPDGRVRICGVPPMSWPPHPWTPLRGNTLGGRTLIQYTLELKQHCSTWLTLSQAIWFARSIGWWKDGAAGIIISPASCLLYIPPDHEVLLGEARWSVHRGGFCQFPFQWLYYCHSSKLTRK